MSIHCFSLLASLIFATPSDSPRVVRHDSVRVPAVSIVDSLRIFYIGRPAGWERYELKPSAGGMTLTSDYDYVDRGRRNHTQLTINVANDYAQRR